MCTSPAVFVSTVGAVGGVLFVSHSDMKVVVDAWKINILNWKPETSNNVAHITMLARRGHPGNIVRCNETGELFASQRRASEMMNVSRYDLTQHLQGEQPHVKGLTFTKLGEAS